MYSSLPHSFCWRVSVAEQIVMRTFLPAVKQLPDLQSLDYWTKALSMRANKPLSDSRAYSDQTRSSLSYMTRLYVGYKKKKTRWPHWSQKDTEEIQQLHYKVMYQNGELN